jgi:C1A family cysteine protease
LSQITPYQHVLGWSRDLPDHRDFLYSAPRDVVTSLPPAVDLRDSMPAVYDQGQIGSCTANAIGGAVQFDRLNTGKSPDFVPSRLFIYYNERAIERTVPLDAGAMIRDGIKVVATKGVPDETLWPYIATPADPDTNLFPLGSAPRSNPPPAVYGAAWHYKALTYSRVTQNLNQLKGCLAEGFPFVFGFTVYSNIYDASGNPVTILNLPSSSDQQLGGHAIAAVGYEDATSMFIIRNSWGPNVMDNGYFYMSYSYVTEASLSNDFWTIRTESA